MMSAFKILVSLAVKRLSKYDLNIPLVVFVMMISLDSVHALHMPLSFPFSSHSLVVSCLTSHLVLPICVMHL
ncbi:hypothetical protein BKA60DRAFT_572752, partial [Fusarium oxysporum]